MESYVGGLVCDSCSLLSEETIQRSGGSLFAEGKSLLAVTKWDRVGRGEIVLGWMCVLGGKEGKSKL